MVWVFEWLVVCGWLGSFGRVVRRRRSRTDFIARAHRAPTTYPLFPLSSLCRNQVALDGTLELACSAVFADEAAAPQLLASVSAAAQPASVAIS